MKKIYLLFIALFFALNLHSKEAAKAVPSGEISHLEGKHTDGMPIGKKRTGNTVKLKSSITRLEHAESFANVIVANDNTYNVSSCQQISFAQSVLANDTVNGGAATTTNTDMTFSGLPAGVTVNAAGNISINTSLAPGIYTFTYNLCDAASSTNCDQATITINVTATIVAENDTYSVPLGVATTPAPSVLNNDIFHCGGASLSTVDITVVSMSHWGVTLNTATGVVSVTAAVPAGTYYINYKICDKQNPVNCDNASITVIVSASNNTIITDNESFVISSCSSVSTAQSILTGDTFNGVQATTANTDMVLVNPPSGVTLNAGGNLTVSGSVPPGIYIFTYNLCDATNSNNCDEGTITLEVRARIDAINDTYTVPVGVTTTPMASLLANDTYDCIAATPSNTNMSLVTSVSGITLNANTGMITVSNTVAPGTYTLTYSLCDTTAGSTNCDTATITIYVANSINAVNDENLISSTTTNQNAGNVLANDTYAGAAATLADVTVTTQGTLPAGLFHDGSGNFTANNMAPGTYTITYQICDNNAPGSCDTATFTLIVTTPNTGLGTNDIRANNTVRVSGVQTTNGIIIAGDFTNYGGIAANKIARLKYEDLSLDTSFTTTGPLDGTYDPLINDFKILPTNEIIVVGRWGSSFNGVSTQGRSIAKLDPNGVPIANWNYNQPGATQHSFINAVAIVPSDLSIVIVGTFTNFNFSQKTHLARLNQGNGNVIESFHPAGSTGFTGGVPLCVAIQNNFAIIGGSFTHFNGTPVGGIVRVSLSTGAIDPNFNTGGVPTTTPGNRIEEILVQGNDIYVGGSFNTYTGIQRRNIAKLDSNGNLNSSFIGGFNGTVRSIVYQQTPAPFIDEAGAANLYVGGDFTAHSYGSTITNVSYIAYVHPMSGAVGTSMNLGGASGNVHTLTLENSKVKLIVGGEFTQYNGITAQRVTRIFPGYTGNDLTQGQGRPGQPSIGNSDITIYPNPSTGIFNLSFEGDENEKFEIAVYNTLGQILHQGTISPATANQIDLSRFENGNYYIRLSNEQRTINKIVTKK